jgi:hypothetical protein
MTGLSVPLLVPLCMRVHPPQLQCRLALPFGEQLISRAHTGCCTVSLYAAPVLCHCCVLLPGCGRALGSTLPSGWKVVCEDQARLLRFSVFSLFSLHWCSTCMACVPCGCVQRHMILLDATKGASASTLRMQHVPVHAASVSGHQCFCVYQYSCSPLQALKPSQANYSLHQQEIDPKDLPASKWLAGFLLFCPVCHGHHPKLFPTAQSASLDTGSTPNPLSKCVTTCLPQKSSWAVFHE